MEKKAFAPYSIVKSVVVNGVQYVEAVHLQEAISEIARLNELLSDIQSIRKIVDDVEKTGIV